MYLLIIYFFVAAMFALMAKPSTNQINAVNLSEQMRVSRLRADLQAYGRSLTLAPGTSQAAICNVMMNNAGLVGYVPLNCQHGRPYWETVSTDGGNKSWYISTSSGGMHDPLSWRPIIRNFADGSRGNFYIYRGNEFEGINLQGRIGITRVPANQEVVAAIAGRFSSEVGALVWERN